MALTAKAMSDFLEFYACKLDAELVKEMTPDGCAWIGNVSYDPPWWRSREVVRKLSEGQAFNPSEPVRFKWGD